MKNYFFCLLPEANSNLYTKVKTLSDLIDSPQIKTPLHLTIYFLSKLNDSQITKAKQWLHKKNLKKIEAQIIGLNSFSKEAKEFVFFLQIESKIVQSLNTNLSKLFQDFHKDEFSFVPHISILFPNPPLPEQNKIILKKHFQDIKQITFDRLALASEQAGKIKLEELINLQ